MTGMFRSLRSFNYRVWFMGAFVSNVGTWVQTTAMNWYILTDLTDGDAAAVGFAFALQYGPALLLVPVTGWLADRFERRRVILVTQTLQLLQTVALGVVVLTGAANLPLLFLFSLLYGTVNACDIPVRQTFVNDLVRSDDISNAIALNSASFNLGRLVGPAAAGFILLAWGAGWAFVVNGTSYLALILAALLLRRRELAPHVRHSRPPSIWGGVAYIRQRSDILALVLCMFLIVAFTINLPLISAVMVNSLGGDAADFGITNSLVAVGSIAGALLAAQRPRARMSILVISFALLALAAVGGAAAPTLAWYNITLIVSGFAAILALSTANGYVQSMTPLPVRGRVMAAYMAVILGSTMVGSPILGAVADAWGPRWTVALGAAAAVIAFVISVALLSRAGGASAEPEPSQI